MTLEEIKMRVAAVGTHRSKGRIAREIEEALWFDVLVAIANGETADPVECAKAAIETQQFWPNWAIRGQL